MVMDAVRGYVQLANGLTEVTRQRAQQAAKALLQQAGAENLTSGLTKVSDLADEIVATSKSNRALLQAIVANEVEGAVARLGFVRVEEVAALSRRIQNLEREMAAASTRPPAPATSAAPADLAGPPAPAETVPASKAPVKAPAKAAVKAPAKSPVKAPVKAAVKAPAKKQPAAKKSPAKKAAAKKAPAKKA
jgi:polyhydroxyalkanoate synthesis regulator phasin